MTDFDLRKFLTENRLTQVSQTLQESPTPPPPFDPSQGLKAVEYYLQTFDVSDWEEEDGDPDLGSYLGLGSPIPTDPRRWGEDLVGDIIEKYYLEGPYKAWVDQGFETEEEEQADIDRYESYFRGLRDLALNSSEFASSVQDLIDDMRDEVGRGEVDRRGRNPYGWNKPR